MLRSSWALVLVLSAAPPAELAAVARESVDGGASPAAHQTAAVDTDDAGGPPVLARLRSIDGGSLFDGGYTDLVELSVGASVELEFPRAVMLTVCDSPIVEVVTRGDHLLLEGAKPGVTQCGFWFDPGAVPGRLVAVSVER